MYLSFTRTKLCYDVAISSLVSAAQVLIRRKRLQEHLVQKIKNKITSLCCEGEGGRSVSLINGTGSKADCGNARENHGENGRQVSYEPDSLQLCRDGRTSGECVAIYWWLSPISIPPWVSLTTKKIYINLTSVTVNEWNSSTRSSKVHSDSNY